MVTDLTVQEYLQILKAESDTPENIVCPRCGSKMHVQPLENGAREVKCETESCIALVFRGI